MFLSFPPTSLLPNFSLVVLLSNQLHQLKQDPASLAVLLPALLGCEGERVHHGMRNVAATSSTAVFFKGPRVKAEALDAAPENMVACINTQTLQHKA